MKSKNSLRMLVVPALLFSFMLSPASDVSAADWSAPESIGSGQGWMVLSPSIAGNAMGQEIVAWMEWDVDTAAGVWANQYAPATGWAGAVLLAEIVDLVGYSAAGIDDDGVCTVAWIDGATVLSMSYIPSSGWQEPVTVGISSGRWAYGLQLAVSPGGAAMLIWFEDSQSSYGPILTSYRSSPDSAWTAPVPIQQSADPLMYPSIAIDGQGVVIAVFSLYDGDLWGIWANRYVPGYGWEGERPIQSETGPGFAPSLSVTRNGNAVACWQQFEGSWSPPSVPYVNMYTPATGWGTAMNLEDAPHAGCASPDVALGEDGSAVAAWRMIIPDQSASYIRTSRYVPEMGWSAPTTLDGSLNGLDTDVAVGPDSNAYISWIGGFDWQNSTNDIFVSHYNDSVGWEPTVLLAEGNCSAPDVLAENDGGAVVLFARETSGWDVFVCRLAGSGTPPLDPTKPVAVIDAYARANCRVWAFDARGSTDDVKVVKYAWDFDDGCLSRARYVSHCYKAPGQYTVTLTVWDGDGNSNTLSMSIMVAPR